MCLDSFDLFFVNICAAGKQDEKKTSCSLVKVPREAGPVRGVFDEYATTYGEIPTTVVGFWSFGRKEASKILCLKWFWS